MSERCLLLPKQCCSCCCAMPLPLPLLAAFPCCSPPANAQCLLLPYTLTAYYA